MTARQTSDRSAPTVAVDLDHAIGLAEAVWDGRPVYGQGVGEQMRTLAAAVLALAQERGR